jgi:hypothetical protein
MARYYNLNRIQIYRKLKSIGWDYTKEESGRIACKVKDFKSIRIKGKKSIIDNNVFLFGSQPENFIRQKISLNLSDKLEMA